MKKMRRLQKTILYVMTLTILLTGIATFRIDAYAAEIEYNSAINTAILEDILNNREYVLDTFADDEDTFIGADNPYASAYGVSGLDYMHKEIMDRYKNNAAYNAMVDIYYTVQHSKESVLSIPAALVGLFDDNTYSSMLNYAEKKKMESLLSQLITEGYISSLGTEFNKESDVLAEYRAYEDSANKIGKYLKGISDINKEVSDAANDYQKHYLVEVMPKYKDGIGSAMYMLGDMVIREPDSEFYSDNLKEFVMTMDEGKNYAMYGFNTEAEGASWKWAKDISVVGEKLTPFLKASGLVISSSNAIFDNIRYLESVLNQKDSLADTLERIGGYAAVNENNLGFQVIALSYVDMLRANDEDSFTAVLLKKCLAEIDSKVSKYIWKGIKGKSEKIAEKHATRILASETASKAYITKTAATYNLAYQFVTATVNKITDFGTSSEKIYELSYLQKIKDYALGVFEEDLRAYKQIYVAFGEEANYAEEVDAAAAKVLDDLEFLKRITLLQNDLGYKIQAGMAKSTVTQYLEMMNGFDYEANIASRHTQIMDALIETNIYELYQDPVTIKEGETLTIVDDHNKFKGEKVGLLRSGTEERFVLEIEKKIAMGGIIMEKDSVLKVETDLFAYFIESGGGDIEIADDALLETMEYTAISGYTNNIKGQMQITDQCYVRGSVSLFDADSGEAAEVKVGGDVELCFNSTKQHYARLNVGKGTLEIGGDFLVNKNADLSRTSTYTTGLYMEDGEGKVLVHGDTYFNGVNTYNGSVLNAGTLELKGDLYGTGTYGYDWECSDDFHMIFSGDEIQTVDVGEYTGGSSINYYMFTRISVTGAGIKCEKPFTAKKAETDLQIWGDVTDFKLDNYNGKTVNIDGDLDFNIFGSSKIADNGTLKVGGDLTLEKGTYAVSFQILEGCLEIDGDLMVNSHKANDGNVYHNSSVNGTSTEAKLLMNHESASMIVKGNAYLYGNANYHTIFQNGTLKLYGDLNQMNEGAYCWKTYSGFDMIFCGSKTQELNITNYDYVYTTKDEYANNVLGNVSFSGSGVDMTGKSIFIYSIQEDVVLGGQPKSLEVQDFNQKVLTIQGDLTLKRGRTSAKFHTLNIHNGTLRVTGDVLLNNARDASDNCTLEIGNGCLEIGGNLYVDMSRGTDGTGTVIGKTEGNQLIMSDAAGKLLVKGDTWMANGRIEAGTVELQGDLHLPDTYSWQMYPNVDVIFSGSELQQVTVKTVSKGTENITNGLGNLQVTGAGIQVTGALGVYKLNSDMMINGDLSNLIVMDGGEYTLTVNGDVTTDATTYLNGNIVIDGDMLRSSSSSSKVTTGQNANVRVTGNCSFYQLHMDGGTFVADRAFNWNLSNYHLIKMNSPEAKLIANSDFTYYGNSDYLTQGTMELNGGNIYFANQFMGTKVHLGGTESGKVQIDASKFLSIMKSNDGEELDLWVEKTEEGYFLTVGENCASVGEITFRQETTPYRPLTIRGNLTVDGSFYSYFDVNIEDSLTVNNMYVRGYTGMDKIYVKVCEDAVLTVNGNLNQYQDSYERIKYLQVDGTAIVHGNMEWADKEYTNDVCYGINYGLIMQNDNSDLTVKGNLSLGTNNILTKGIIRVAGSYEGPTETEGTIIKQILSSMALTEEEVNFNFGDTKQLTLSTQPAGFNISDAVWSSSDPAVVEVNQGLLSGKKPGNAVITVELEGFTDNCNVTVNQGNLSGYRVEGKDSIIYTDSELIAELAVYNNANEVLTENEDYTLEINQSETQAEFVIRGINNYAGEIRFIVNKAYVEEIVIDTEAQKNTYEAGEYFDSTGLKILAVYDNGYTKDVTEQVTFYSEALTADMDKIIFTYMAGEQEFTTQQQIKVFEAYSSDAGVMGVVADDTVGIVDTDSGNIITVLVQPETIITIDDIEILTNNEYAKISGLQLIDGTDNQYTFTITAQDGSEDDYTLVIVNADDEEAYITAKKEALLSVLSAIETVDLEEEAEWTEELIKENVVSAINDNAVMELLSDTITAENVEVTQFTASVHGDADEPLGTDGSYQVQVTFGDDAEIFTIGGKLIAKKYEGISNKQALGQVKATLEQKDFTIESTSIPEDSDALSVVRQWILDEINAQDAEIVISAEDIELVSEQESIKGTAQNPTGMDGFVTVNVTMQKGKITDTLYGLKIVVKAETVEVFHIAISIEGAGSSDQLGSHAVVKGSSFKAEFTPLKGWRLLGYKLDDSPLMPSAELSYEFGEIQSDCTLTAVFEPMIPYPATMSIEQKEWEHTGEAIEPVVTVLDALGNPMSPLDYKVEYDNNIDIGTATVKVVFRGIYEGTVLEDTFEIKAASYQIHFDSAGGSSCDSITVTQQQPYGALPIPEREGYEFLGWWLEDTGEFIDENTMVTANVTHTLVAKWEANWYEVWFDSNGGSYVDWIMVQYDSAYGEYEEFPTPQAAGCIFEGWYTEPEGGERITAETIVSIAGKHTLYARWSYKYTVSAPQADIESETEVEKGSRVRISTSTNGAKIYYVAWNPQTMAESESMYDSASEIMENGDLYEDAIRIEEPISIKAVAVKERYIDSEIVTFTYSVRDDSEDWGDITEEDKERAGLESTADIPEEFWAVGMEDMPYQGSAITFPDIRLYYHKTLLTEKTDYTVKYSKNTNVGVAKITFTGKGNYNGTCVQEFNITPLDLKDAVIDQPVVLVKFNNKVQKKTNKVTYDLKDKTVTLKAGKDFTYEYPNTNSKDTENYDANAFKAVGNHTVILHGKGNYGGTTTFTQSIVDATLVSSLKYTIKGDKYNGGNEVVPATLIVKNGKTELKGCQVADANEVSVALELWKNMDESPDYDYIYYCENNTEIGTANITFIGIEEKGYVGTVSKTYSITGNALKSAKIKLLASSYEWTGTEIDPFVSVEGREAAYLLHGTNELKGISKEAYDAMTNGADDTAKRDYDYIYQLTDNKEIGKATMVLTGVNEYTGTVTKTFKIVGKSISSVKVEGINKIGYDYTGSEVKPAGDVDSNEVPAGFRVYFAKTNKTDEIPLSKTDDYIISYQKNENKGTAALILTGVNGYTGTKKVSFKINAYKMSDQEDRIQIDLIGTVPYQKNGAKPEVTVRDTLTGKVLELNKDYTVKYKNNKEVGNETKKPTVTITGKGNYSGSKEAYFIIENSSLDFENVTMTVKDVVYKNKANIYKSAVTLVDSNGVKLTAGKDYDKNVTYTYAEDQTVTQVTHGLIEDVFREEGEEVHAKDIIPVGTEIKATVTGKGFYADTFQSKTFYFVAADLSKASVKIEKQMYTGREIEPTKDDITVTINRTTLNKTDYEIVGYGNNIKQGKGKVTIKGLGNYGGTKTVDFVIQKKSLWFEFLRRMME